ncbi:Rnase Y domain-containing protein [Chitinophaga sedimenti]|nr:Rnase Y domain-containing protein [Chitinophaga sedimenti]MCK7557700.1 Rnase Y domain-containing protein [Chitinophaga sedimenti]
MEITYILIAAVVALGAGIGLGKLIFAKSTQHKIDEAELEAKKIVTEAEIKAETIKRTACWKPKKSSSS